MPDPPFTPAPGWEIHLLTEETGEHVFVGRHVSGATMHASSHDRAELIAWARGDGYLSGPYRTGADPTGDRLDGILEEHGLDRYGLEPGSPLVLISAFGATDPDVPAIIDAADRALAGLSRSDIVTGLVFDPIATTTPIAGYPVDGLWRVYALHTSGYRGDMCAPHAENSLDAQICSLLADVIYDES